MNRNAMCSCGSGKRFKHCCGRQGEASLQPRFEALAAHRAGSFGRAASLYRRALEENPDDADVLHMLGVVQFSRMRYREALDLVWKAAERTDWAYAEMRHNLGLVLAKLLTREANRRQAELLTESVAWEQSRSRARAEVSPLVTVVLPTYNHGRYVAQAIASVAAQTYPHVELVVIDDGSTDGTAKIVSECVAQLTVPARFVTRENRGAPATLNEGASLARGHYVAFLNSDDYYAPERIACLVEEIARRDVRWGFSLVSCVDESRETRPAGAGMAADFQQQKQRSLTGRHSNSLALVEHDICISSGNLFVERDFFFSLGGFRDYRYNHDWDFCLRAAALAEPMLVHRPLYFYRIHGANTISESRLRATEDADRVFDDFLATALSGDAVCRNPLAPQWPGNRLLVLKLACSGGQGALIPVPALRSLAADLRAARPGPPESGRTSANARTARKTALVVLGMHRSGTSALSRVLNLCGAFLPAKLKPPKLGVNPKGFWEPEAVLDLNTRALLQLGGDWNKVEFSLPGAGDFVEEFESDACALLASEYGEQEMILIKDPRICVLAPLWHRALISAGYRPAYVVPVRNPIEVAQSLHARGDMTVASGLALWLTYMKRVAEFTQSNPDAHYVRYTELLDDWRAVVGLIADHLDVPLDAGGHAEEVGCFLERRLRTHASSQEALDALPPEPSNMEIRALYRTCLSRCDRDASGVQRSPATAGRPIEFLADRRDESPATVSFVLCIENNAIRDQALLLCESIRRFGGRYSNSPILAFAPRPGLGIDAATRRLIARMDVEYVDQPLNATCLEYAPANRVFASAFAETHANTDFLVVVDSDTIFLDEPELPVEADVAVRPVDSKGSATRGPDDLFEDYWARLAELCRIELERLPYLSSTIGNERIRASYNGGLTVARRDKGIFNRCADLFSLSVKAGMRPYRGSGINIHASTGDVGHAGSEYWGSSQAALSLAIWASTERVLHYPDHYNVPLHLLAADGDIDPRWLAHTPVHLHYHWMFGEPHHEIAMEILAKLGVPGNRLAWLADRVPFGGPARAMTPIRRALG